MADDKRDSRAPVLVAEHIRATFGAVVAVADVSLSIADNEVVGLIGPNGSGKTTFLNVLSGIVAGEGALWVEGRRVHLGKPARSRGAGIIRVFQAPQTFANLSCIENVMIGTADRHRTGVGAAIFLQGPMRTHERERRAVAKRSLEKVGLRGLDESPATRLTYGQRRLLDLARAMAGVPRLLILDEPSAGLDDRETSDLAAVIATLARGGLSLLIVEHKMDFIKELCPRVAVMETGYLIADDPATAIWTDPRVIDAYLGAAQ